MELGTRRRGGSGEDWARKRGLRAARGRGEAIGGVFRGGAGLEWRVHGGSELAGVQMDGGGVLGSGGGELTKERED